MNNTLTEAEVKELERAVKGIADGSLIVGEDGKLHSATQACLVCSALTKNIFRIRLKATPICESCANAITLQQVKCLVQLPMANGSGGNP